MLQRDFALYPETVAEIETVNESRQNRATHPNGKFDNGGRWTPSEFEHASCCNYISSPSRAHPYSYMVHCRTHLHIATWFAEHPPVVKEQPAHAKRRTRKTRPAPVVLAPTISPE